MEIRARNSLTIGDIFPHDLVDEDYQLILPAGSPLGMEALNLLRERGTQVLFLRAPVVEHDVFLEPYDAESLRKVQTLINQAPARLEAQWKAVQQGDGSGVHSLDSIFDDTFESITSDVAAFLAGIMQATVDGRASSLAGRSVKLSGLSILVASRLQYSKADCDAIGRAALLHDISLEGHSMWPAEALSGSELQLHYSIHSSHPNDSVSMLRKVGAISDLEAILIAQVHEQCDGKGFPRGLKKHQLHPLGRIINIADAFLTLTDHHNPNGAYVPADALAYLIHHAIHGSFDLEFTKTLITVAAAYPIGTQVQLSDSSVATVMRSTDTYCEPLIQCVDQGQAVLDLRGARIQIEAPTANDSMRRLPKSRLHENLWRQSYG